MADESRLQMDAKDDVAEMVSIPDAKYAPKPEPKPFYRPEIKNFADVEDSVSKTLAWFKAYKDRYKEQGAWVKSRTNDDTADEMYRAALTRSQVENDASANKENTRSNVSSTAYNRTIRVITAGEMAVTLGNEELLPVVYEPPQGATEYQEGEALEVAHERNMILSYTFDTDKMREKIRKIYTFVNKYGNGLVEMAWDYRKTKEMRRVPVKWAKTKEGQPRRPTKYAFEWVDVMLADNPTLIWHDKKDCGFDAMIDDIQDQSCLYTRAQRNISDIWEFSATGQYKNVGKITTDMQYQGEGDASQQKDDRQANAGESSDANKETSQFDIWTTMIRVPINDDTGKWDPKKEIPHWYKAVFVGDIDGKPVCVQLSPNPAFCSKIPYLLMHSHDDDKGALHLGYAILTFGLYMMETTVFNQTFDNNTKRTEVPMIADDGSIRVRDKKFRAGGNQWWWLRPGARPPTQVNVQDTTQQSIPLLKEIQEIYKDTVGTNKPFLGEALGSRTSASEAIGVLEQATKPALEDAKYKANQLFPFIAEWSARFWELFSDPNREIMITYEGITKSVNPAELYGPIQTRVTAIKRFQDNVLRRKEENTFLSQIFPIAEKYMKKTGVVSMLTQVLENRGYENVSDLWDVGSDFDARHVAQSEGQAILFEGIIDMPKPDENHEAHLDEHNQDLAGYEVGMTPEEYNDQNVRHMKQHILIHEQMMGAAEQQKQLGPAQAAAPEDSARTVGEETGDMISGEENMPEGGRPPMATEGV